VIFRLILFFSIIIVVGLYIIFGADVAGLFVMAGIVNNEELLTKTTIGLFP